MAARAGALMWVAVQAAAQTMTEPPDERLEAAVAALADVLNTTPAVVLQAVAAMLTPPPTPAPPVCTDDAPTVAGLAVGLALALLLCCALLVALLLPRVRAWRAAGSSRWGDAAFPGGTEDPLLWFRTPARPQLDHAPLYNVPLA
eukprot:TRINITY_DN21591_c0_g1_i1.p3 TRINITY_DN21591_c0_g1~~TRINITY_DN21591_c0_g1_i1.p3  ORF type:complete len:145 (+),score=47.59 TRINITY_DN21591_c0_g1_i1:124-558(+)